MRAIFTAVSILFASITAYCEGASDRTYSPNGAQYGYLDLTNAYYTVYGDGNLYTNDFQPTRVDWFYVQNISVNSNQLDAATAAVLAYHAKDGTNGLDGATGADGATGSTGTTGSTGSVGAPGINAMPSFLSATNDIITSGVWRTNQSDYTVFVHIRYDVTLAALAGTIKLGAWSRPAFNSTLTVTNDAKSYTSFLALLTGQTISDSMLVEVPPHWTFCGLTNMVSTAGTPPATGLATYTINP